MILVLLLIALVGYVVWKKVTWTETAKKRKELVRELRRSGKLNKELDELYVTLIKKKREAKASKERSIRLMQQFVGLNANKHKQK